MNPYSLAQKYYILNGHDVVEVADPHEWSLAFDNNRIVDKTIVGNQEVSTVFIGLEGQIFETMIFPEGEYCRRCDTWNEAVAQHAEAIKYLEGKGGE
jgi:hypothetical protein